LDCFNCAFDERERSECFGCCSTFGVGARAEEDVIGGESGRGDEEVFGELVAEALICS